MIPRINKPMRVTRQVPSTIDHIITSSIVHTGYKSGIIKLTSLIISQFSIHKYIAEKKMLSRDLYISVNSPISQ